MSVNDYIPRIISLHFSPVAIMTAGDTVPFVLVVLASLFPLSGLGSEFVVASATTC